MGIGDEKKLALKLTLSSQIEQTVVTDNKGGISGHVRHNPGIGCGLPSSLFGG